MNEHCYALIVSVSHYEDEQIADLPSGASEIREVKAALVRGLHFTVSRIRALGADGSVSLREFVRALQEYASLLTEEDLFLLFFSGHGSPGQLHFTDGAIDLQSVADYLAGMRTRSRILILDCCFAGSVRMPAVREMKFEDSVNAFAGCGIAVMASSSPDERSWLDPVSGISLFTEALCAAMRSRRRLYEGRKSLFDLNEEVRAYMEWRNRRDPGHIQHPIFRASLGGTVYFPVVPWSPEEAPEVLIGGRGYVICGVKPLSTAAVRRLAVMIRTEGRAGAGRIARMTKEAAELLKEWPDAGADGTAGAGNNPLRVLFCYFGQDTRDMKESTYYADSIWAADEETRGRFFRKAKQSCVEDGIWIRENPSYDLIRKMRSIQPDPGKYRDDLKRFLASLTSRAEEFIAGLHAWKNGEQSLAGLRAEYGSWYREVQRQYILLTDLPVPPEGLAVWCDAVFELAGWVMNLALPLDEKTDYREADAEWLLTYAAGKYYESLERIRALENVARQATFSFSD